MSGHINLEIHQIEINQIFTIIVKIPQLVVMYLVFFLLQMKRLFMNGGFPIFGPSYWLFSNKHY